MPRWTRDEIEEHWAHYQKVARRCGPSGKWDEFVDLYTEDTVMLVSGGVRIGGHEAIRRDGWLAAQRRCAEQAR